MASWMLLLGVISYGSAALFYGVAAVIVVVTRPRDRRSVLMTLAIITSSVWAVGMMLSLLVAKSAPLVLAGLDAMHLFVWTACVLAWLEPPSARRWLLALSAVAGVVAIGGALSVGPASGWTYPALLLMSLTGFLAVEQVYRNAKEEAREQLKLLCLAAGGVAAVHLFVFSQAVLLGSPVTLFWEARGFLNLLLLPLIVMAVRRQSGWERELFVSRQVVFYTASLLGAGGYLFAMGVVAYIIDAYGREWSFPLDLLFLVVGLATLFGVLFSANIRARLRVLLTKHFYRSKYDYREEWLRLTQNLSRTGDLLQAAANGLEGMARIIGSQRGDLWVERDDHRYEWLFSLTGETMSQAHFERSHPLVSFLASTGWVIDSDEYEREPDRYRNAFGDPAERVLPRNAVIVPLDRQGYLQGFMILEKPPALRSLNFDDHDILKTAGRQVAAVLAQALAQEKLTETRQFEALNRMSTFLMHDLKNIVAQQELVVANAQRFRHRAEFIDDAFATVRSGTGRIKKVLEQLSSASRKSVLSRVDISKVLIEVRSQCADRQPIPEIDVQAQAAWVRMDRDELVSVLLHLVRNAQDATPAEGRITIGLAATNTEHLITITDNGAGMNATFMRDRLFRPFDSTKGQTGMGIGAYQARHLVRQAGGELDVVSEPGRGTTFTIRLPIAN